MEAVKRDVDFLVSPGIDEQVLKAAQKKDTLIIPGVATPGEIQQAVRFGLGTVKLFPAEQLGGTDYLKALSGPYSKMKFFPTGGISNDNISEYLSCSNVICCGGSWLVTKNLLDTGNYGRIEKNARDTIRKIMGFQLKHIGINCVCAEEAKSVAEEFNAVFGFKCNENASSIFCNDDVEVLKKEYFGKKGHIAIGTTNPGKAVIYLERNGITFNKNSAVYRNDGELHAIYLQKEIGEFAIHLVKK